MPPSAISIRRKSFAANTDRVFGRHRYENIDGLGTFGTQQVITTEADGARSVYAADVDGDGDVDVLSASRFDDKIAWYENRLAGDSDDDGKVALADFLILSSNFGRTGAAWEDGDFNGDDKVTFEDFLILSESFGNKRPNAEPVLPSENQVSAAATDEFFSQHNDESAQDEIVLENVGNPLMQ